MLLAAIGTKLYQLLRKMTKDNLLSIGRRVASSLDKLHDGCYTVLLLKKCVRVSALIRCKLDSVLCLRSLTQRMFFEKSLRVTCNLLTTINKSCCGNILL